MHAPTPHRTIPVTLNPKLEIVVPAAPIAQALELDVAQFLLLLEQRKIDQLCERGTDEDEGLYRASFYHAGKRARVVVNRQGQIQGEVERRSR